MRKRHAWKRIAAWVLTAAMITGSNSFAVLAQELAEEPVQEAAVQEVAAEYGTAESVEQVPEEPAAQSMEEVPVEVPEEAPAEGQEPTDEGDADAAPEQEAAGESTEIPETAEAAESENEATPEDTGDGSDDEEVIIGDEGLEAEVLPESVDEAIAEALLAEEADEEESAQEAQEPQYWYTLPLSNPKENEMLPGQEIRIENTMYCWVEDGENSHEESVPVTNVEILQEYTWDENGNDVEAEAGSVVGISGDAENGWTISGRDCGYARLRITFTTADGKTETYGNLTDEEYLVYVYGDVYHVDLEYPKGSTNMLAGETMEIPLTLNREYHDEDGNWRYDAVEDVKFVLMEGDEGPLYDTETVDVSISGNVISITGKKVGGTDIYVDALIPNESGEYEPVSWERIWVDVCEGYLNMEPAKVDNVEIGEVLNVNDLGIQVVSYSPDNSRQSAVVENVRFRITDYDNDAWEDVSGEGGITTALKRKGTWETSVHIVAEVNRAEEGEEWEEICDRWYRFDELRYDVWLEGMRGDGWSWVFYNEDQTLTLNTESLGDREFTIDWEVGQYDENGNFTEVGDTSAYTDNEDGSITLHGAYLAKLYPEAGGDNPFQVRATVRMNGVEVTGTTNDIRMWEPYYDYYFPATDPGDRDLLPGENIWIEKWMSGYVSDPNHPNGEQLDNFEVTDVEITAQGTWDENGNEVPLKEGGEERVRLETEADGWRLCAENYGWAKIRMTYIDANGNKAVYGEAADDEFYVYVHGEVYRLDLTYPDNSNRMPYPGELTIQSSLRLERDGEGREAVENYRLVLPTDEEGNPWYDAEAIEAAVTEDGKGIVVRSKRSDCGARIAVIVEVPDDSEESGWREACMAYANVEVMDNYYVIRFANIPEDGIWTQIGETLDISGLQPEVYACNAENPQGVLLEEDENLHITLIRSENQEIGWDDNAWEVVAGTEDSLIPTLKRKGSWGTGITVFVEERAFDENGNPETDEDGNAIWRENCRVDLDVPDLEYNVQFSDLRGWQEGGDHTWVFTDEDLTLNLRMENILVDPERISVEWQIGTWNDATQTVEGIIDNRNGEYYEPVENDGVFGITLHGGKLAELYHDDNTWCNLSGTVYVDGIEVWQTGTGVDVRTPRYDYNFPLSGAWENAMLPYWGRDIGNQIDCYIENAEHPWGENISVPIENVEILGQGHSWNWDEYRPDDYEISDNGEEIITLNGNAEEGWSLQSNGNGYGFAHIRITYTDVKTNERTNYEFPEFVGGELYEFWYDYSDNTDFMLPNSKMEITTGLKRYYVGEDENNTEEMLEDYRLSVNWDDGNATYDTNLLSVEVVDNTKLRITSNDNQWSTDFYVRVMRQNAETGEYEEVTGDNVHVNVSDGYFSLEPSALVKDGENVNPLLDETLNIAEFDPALVYYSSDKEPQTQNEVKYVLEYDENAWDIANGSQAVSEPVTADALPKLVRKTTWGTSVDLLAIINVAGDQEEENWQEVTRRTYNFDDITNRYETDFIYSYGERMDEVHEGDTVVSRILTDIPLVLTVDTAGLHGLEDYQVAWSFWYFNEETGEDEEGTQCATAEVAADGKSVSILGLQDHQGEWLNVRAVITYNDSYVAETWTHAMVDTCAHSWDKGVITKASTCAVKGIKTYTCAKCGAQRTEELPLATDHTWNAGSITKQPTCTETGIKTYTCTVCGRTKTEAVAALGHAYSTAYTVDRAATCTKEGSKSRHCTRCGAKTDVTAIPKIPHKGGTATVLAQAKCEVCGQAYGSKLKPVLKLTANSLKMKVKQSTVAFNVTAMEKGDYVVSVKSSNTKILKVSNLNKTKGTFKLTAQKKSGKAKLTVKLASGLSKTITVTVQKSTVKTTSISGLPSKVTLDKGKKTTLLPVLAPVTSQQKVTYKSSNKKIATVSSKGVIKAVKPGKATITVKSGSKSKKVTVVVNPIKTTKITGVPSTATIKKGKKLTLKAKLTPSNSTEGIKYTTSNKKVATVTSKGVIKGVKKGTAIITVISGSKKVTCKVTVK